MYKSQRFLLMALLATAAAILIACTDAPPPVVTSEAGPDFSIEIVQESVDRRPLCNGSFFPHYLDHITTNQYVPVDMYDSNGSGVAADDIDNDGDIDIVLANLAGPNQLFINQGNYSFQQTEFPHGSSRAVAIVDVDGDGWKDVAFTTRVGRISYWRNLGLATSNRSFPLEAASLDGVDEHAYAMAWQDLDADGDLDLITGSYDTALEKELRDSFMFGDGAGVFVYTNNNGIFESQRLADTSQALAIALMDIDLDGRDDILIGNDFFSVQDQVFYARDNGWELAEPFEMTTQNTMSFDIGDINNDGSLELFAADMHPYAFDAETEAAWAPVMETMHTHPAPDDPQRMENALQTLTADGNFTNIAPDAGVAFSGWSWSSRFSDLDQDGFLDLYIVNGMATFETFGHLPNNELIEENQAFRNLGDGSFAPAPKWRLNATEGGRGMTMADIDGDGDLDIIVNNLLSNAIIYENRLCTGSSLLVELDWQQDGIANIDAIGSAAQLTSAAGIQSREVSVMSGYLSGTPAIMHFGVASDDQIDTLVITWPDGVTTEVTQINPNSKLKISRRG